MFHVLSESSEQEESLFSRNNLDNKVILYYTGVPSSCLGRGQKSEVWKGLGEESWREIGEESVKKQKTRGEKGKREREMGKEREIRGVGGTCTLTRKLYLHGLYFRFIQSCLTN